MKISKTLEKLIFVLTCAVTLIAMIFINKPIPSHISAGNYIDEVSSSFYLMIYPAIQVLILLVSRNNKVKYLMMHSKILLTTEQYQWIVNGILLFVFLVEATMLYTAFLI